MTDKKELTLEQEVEEIRREFRRAKFDARQRFMIMKLFEQLDEVDDENQKLRHVAAAARDVCRAAEVSANRSANVVCEVPVGLIAVLKDTLDVRAGVISNMRGRWATLYDVLKHGDEDHQKWLKEAITAHFTGNEVPPPYGKGARDTESPGEGT